MFDTPEAESAAASFRPSEYTAALIMSLRAAAVLDGARVLEIGCGSGVVLAAAGALGAASLDGIDIERAAVAASARLLREVGYGEKSRLHLGDMWSPVRGRRFDLIVANLPQFPVPAGVEIGERASWHDGGPDGRRLLDRCLDGLGAYLAPGGRALLTHNGFIGLARSRRRAARQGLRLDVVARVLVSIPPWKLALMTPEILEAEQGRTLHRYGAHVFGEMCVVEIAAPA